MREWIGIFLEVIIYIFLENMWDYSYLYFFDGVGLIVEFNIRVRILFMFIFNCK